MKKYLLTFVVMCGTCVASAYSTTWTCTSSAWKYKNTALSISNATMYLVSTNDAAAYAAFTAGLADGSIGTRNIVNQDCLLASTNLTSKTGGFTDIPVTVTATRVGAVCVLFDKRSVPGTTFYRVSLPSVTIIGEADPGTGSSTTRGFSFDADSFATQPWIAVDDTAATVLTVAEE